ncbi:hypothetical protein LCGC14_3113640, partial [marine sediment metagenome]
MSVLFTAKQICEMALQAIGAYSINDTAAEPEHLKRALSWFDLNMAELAGIQRMFWLVPSTLTIALAADKRTYDLLDTLGASAPADGIQFPVEAHLDDGSGNRTPLEILRRDEYEGLAKLTTTGTPDRIYIDRLIEPTMSVYPIPTVSTDKVKLVVQTFAPSFASSRTGGSATGLRAAWQNWAVNKLAASLGNGPIRKLPRQEISDYLQLA